MLDMNFEYLDWVVSMVKARLKIYNSHVYSHSKIHSTPNKNAVFAEWKCCALDLIETFISVVP